MAASSKTPKDTTTTPIPAAPPAAPTPAASPPVITGVAADANHASKVELQTAYQALVNGLQSSFAATDTFVIEQVEYTRDQLVAEFQRFITAAETTKADNAAWRASVVAEHAALEQVAPLREGVLHNLQGRLGKRSPALRNYGFAPYKAPVRTVQSKSAALARAEATRAAHAKTTAPAAAAQATAAASAAPAGAPVAPPATPPAPKPGS
jgi:hypothetical protein